MMVLICIFSCSSVSNRFSMVNAYPLPGMLSVKRGKRFDRNSSPSHGSGLMLGLYIQAHGVNDEEM
jgi:hypothetical protein